MKKTVTLVIHGHRKLSDNTLETIQLLEEETTLSINKVITKIHGEAREIAQKAAENADVIIAVGGDGTCNEIINGLMHDPNTNIVFGVIPNGTGNDFARNFPTFDPYTFVTSIVEGSVTHIDLGKITFDSTIRYFANVADIGFGASVVETMNRQRMKGIGGKLSYSLAIIRTFLTFKKSIIKVQNDSFQYEGKSLMIVFSNGSTFGSGLQIYPDGKLDSGKLGLTVIGDVSLAEYAKNLGNLKEGRKIIHPEVIYQDFKKIHVSSPDKKLFVETDGEIAGQSSITIEVIPKTLQVVL